MKGRVGFVGCRYYAYKQIYLPNTLLHPTLESNSLHYRQERSLMDTYDYLLVELVRTL